MTRQYPDRNALPVEVPLSALMCPVCRAKATRFCAIGIYPVPFCDNHEPPKEPSNRLIHAARNLDCNRAAGSVMEVVHLVCKVGEMLDEIR